MLSQTVLRALRFAFPLTVPIAAGFLFIGLTYGLFTVSQGLPLGYPLIMCLLIFAGSMEFITVTLLFQPFDPVGAFIMALMVNGRHLFYAITMLGKYRGKGWKTPYLIYGMCDESFAINMSTRLPDDVDKKWFYFHVSWLNYMFWVFSTFVGGLFGNLLATVDLRGIDFVLPGLFIVVFLEMLLNAKNNKIRAFGVAGAAMAIVMLLLVGKSLFMLLSMSCMLVACYIAYKWGGVHLD